MSSGILDKLKIKPNPEKNEENRVEIKFNNTIDNTIDNTTDNNEEVVLNTKIIDKIDTNEEDREEMLKRFYMMTSSKIPKQKTEAIIVEQPKKVKKLNKKLTLVSEDMVAEKKTESQIEKMVKEAKQVGQRVEQDLGEDFGVKPKGRRTKKATFDVIADDVVVEYVGNTSVKERMPVKDKQVLLRANSYYMNNRESFIGFVNALFKPYKEEFKNVESSLSCDRPDNAKFALLTHQKVVRDYLNLYTPYRGLLLYHGLGSGKTCTSIAIAEGMKTDKQIIVMTPASLRMNYLEELKNCGDLLYKKNQFWEFISIKKTDNKGVNTDEIIDTLSNLLQLGKDYIKKQGGAWMVNVTKTTNYDTIPEDQRVTLNAQINEMIRNKYRFINYNGLLNSHLKGLTEDYSINPFDNKVIIIDEAHNFVSRIVNKLKKPESLSMRLYNYLLSAENSRIVMLTGTPMINYPNEISILFNILRGFIKTWTFPLTIQTGRKFNKEEMTKIFAKYEILDFLDYKPTSKLLTVTRNPFGFINVTKDNLYKGVSNVKTGQRGNVNDAEFVKMVTSILNKNDIDVNSRSIQVDNFKALPDSLDDFKKRFIDESTGKMKNDNLFKRRILGLTSYFKSAQEQLMPSFNKDIDFKVIKIPMSDFQLGVYEQARIQERKLEKASKSKRKAPAKPTDNLYDESVSTYRIFSRAFCNFVFPTEKKRPMPKDGEEISDSLKEVVNENILDALSVKETIDNAGGKYTLEDTALLEAEHKNEQDVTYDQRIKDSMIFLKDNSVKYLSPTGLETYSPKFLTILENLQDPEYRGLHLIYTQFRTLEGIGILKLILEANGFAQFKIKRDDSGTWRLNMSVEDMGKPTFALYTGTETPEEKEIIRNIFNSTWNYVPDSITSDLARISTNNLYGEIIKVLMITASGAEGISLKNTRYVHIVEPYWHPVRIEQVIGRARRICSHQELPPNLRTVQVFLYLMTFTEEQVSGDKSVQLRLNDGSKFDDSIPVSSDEALYEISTIKETISKQLLKAITESSMDCALYNRPGTKNAISCFSFGKTLPTSFAYKPSISNEESDSITENNKQEIEWIPRTVKIPIDGIKREFIQNTTPTVKKDPKSGASLNWYEIYDKDSYNERKEYGTGDLIMIGHLIQKLNAKTFKFVPV